MFKIIIAVIIAISVLIVPSMTFATADLVVDYSQSIGTVQRKALGFEWINWDIGGIKNQENYIRPLKPIIIKDSLPPTIPTSLSTRGQCIVGNSLYSQHNVGWVWVDDPNGLIRAEPFVPTVPNTYPYSGEIWVAGHAPWNYWNEWDDIVTQRYYKWTNRDRNGTPLTGGAVTREFIIWAEPDGAYFFPVVLGETEAQTKSHFFEVWHRTYDKLRQLSAGCTIIGPVTYWFNEAYISDFLTYAKDNSCLPDILAWHEVTNIGTNQPPYDFNLNKNIGVAYYDPAFIKTHLTTVQGLLNAKNITSITRFAIPEYQGYNEQYSPAATVAFIANLEEAGIEGGKGNTDDSGGIFSGLMTNPKPYPPQPRSIWWVYKSYADMSGSLYKNTPAANSNLNAVVSYNSSTLVSRILVGNKGVQVNKVISLINIPTSLVTSGYTYASVQKIQNSGTNALSNPTLISQGSLAVSSNSAQITISNFGEQDAYLITLQPNQTPKSTTLFYPPNNKVETGSAITFSWSEVPFANQYALRVRRTTGAKEEIFNSTITSTSQLVNIPNDDYYEWQVWAGYNGSFAATSSVWVVHRVYAVTIPDPPPVLMSPVHNSSQPGTSITLNWNVAEGATKYYLRVCRISDNAYIHDAELGNVTSQVVNNFPNNGTVYDWYLWAGNSAGWSTRSATWRFTNAPAAPLPPVLVSPANNSNQASTSVTFQWNAVSGATDYHLYVHKSDMTAIYNSNVGNVTSYQVNGFPNDGTVYWWGVWSHNAIGYSPVSDVRSFANGTAPIIPQPPILVAPANNSNQASTSVTFQWNASTGATNYHLYIYKGDMVAIYNGFVGNVTSYQVRGFPNNGTSYNWAVWAYNPLGYSTVSEVRSFINGTAPQLPPAPVLVSPVNSTHIPATSITFQWNASTGATSYHLYVHKGDMTAIYNGSVGNVTSYGVNGFPNDGTGYWWAVWACNANGYSPVSEVRNLINGQ